MRRGMELKGMQFGRLTVEEESERRDGKNRYWWCSCECGMWAIVRQDNLLSFHTTSCGCLREENLKNFGKKGEKDGIFGSTDGGDWGSDGGD